MTTPTPTPGALSAARELHSENWSVMTYDQMVISGALIIDRHTARTDVDALVKALEATYALALAWANYYGMQYECKGGAHPRHRAILDEAKAALARHAKGGEAAK